MPLFGLSKSDVAKMEAKRDVQGLIKALAYQKDEMLCYFPTGESPPGKWKDHAMVRESAAEALGRSGDEKTVDALITALKDPDINVRKMAALALGEIGGEKAVDALIAAFKEKDWLILHKSGNLSAEFRLKEQYSTVRVSAAFALAKTGNTRAVPALTAALQDPAVKVRESAAEALKELEKKIRSSGSQPSSTAGGGLAVSSHARSTLGAEDEQFAQKLAQLSKLSDIQYATDKPAYEKTTAEFRRIGEQLCANGGDERMKRVALRVQEFGGRSLDCDMYWVGICGWMA